MNDLETHSRSTTGDGDPNGQEAQILGGLSESPRSDGRSRCRIATSCPWSIFMQAMPAAILGAVSEAVAGRAEANEKRRATRRDRASAGTGGDDEGGLHATLIGLALSILLVYLVIVVNFQSWLDPFIIITALPGALAGIIWSLFLTNTTLSVPALTGAIMCMGTATANSILVVSLPAMSSPRMAIPFGQPWRPGMPLASGADDGTRHDHRHAADVDGQYPERPAGAAP